MSESVKLRGDNRDRAINGVLLTLAALGLAALLAIDLVAALTRSGHPAAAAPSAPAVPSTTAPAPTTTVATTIPQQRAVATGGTYVRRPSCNAPATVMVPDLTEVAHLAGNTPGSYSPGAPPNKTVPGSWYGYPSALPVIAAQPGWLEVREAQRPNGATAWIPDDNVTFSTTPYAMVLNLCTAHLLVFQSGQEIYDFPAGIGAPDDPTVTGDYFVSMTTPPPGPGYGPFVLATSAHSDAIRSWEGQGDAIIGIHGPITAYDDRLIGTSGAAISHGCIRLHDADLAKLSVIPAGTPLQIVG